MWRHVSTRGQSVGLTGSRRLFLKNGAIWMAAAGWTIPDDLSAGSGPLARVGLISDLHYADKDPKGTRHYRETLGKLTRAGEFFAKQAPDFVVELGDLIDAADSIEVELGYLKRINREFSAIAPVRHHVLGNHCVDTLTKAEFLGEVGQAASYYSFDQGGVHFVVLDACFRADGAAYQRRNFEWTDANLPPVELEWLRADLEAAGGPVIVFAHQRLDGDGKHDVKNAAEVRRILEGSGKVLAVFQGHSHQNDHREVGGIHYATLRAMVEGGGPGDNGYSLLEVFPGGVLKLTGEALQKGYEW